MKKQKYKIKVWIPCEIDEDEDEIYDTRGKALKEKLSMELMQPENKYEIEEIEVED